jgi:hypothetical protein
VGDVGMGVASTEDWYPILDPVNDKFARGNHVFDQEFEKDPVNM